MKKVYKVLLPLYKDDEMQKEVEQEWQMDSANHGELNLHLLTKLLFRVAHNWATHIDLEEYIEVLEKVYQRITVRKVICAKDNKTVICYPTIYCDVVPDPDEAE